MHTYLARYKMCIFLQLFFKIFKHFLPKSLYYPEREQKIYFGPYEATAPPPTIRGVLKFTGQGAKLA